MLKYAEVILWTLKLVKAFYDYAYRQGLLNEGAQKQILKETLELQSRIKVFRDIEEKNAGMTIADIRKAMESDFRD